MEERIEIQISGPLAEALLCSAAHQERNVEELLESIIYDYLKGLPKNGRR